MRPIISPPIYIPDCNIPLLLSSDSVFVLEPHELMEDEFLASVNVSPCIIGAMFYSTYQRMWV